MDKLRSHNYMPKLIPQMAHMLGKEIGEEFFIYPTNKLLGNYHQKVKCKFTETDVFWEVRNEWCKMKGGLYDLLTGETKIIE